MTSDPGQPFFDRAEPRPEFQDQLRRAFVDGAFATGGEQGQSDTDEARLAGMLAPGSARAEFAAGLRARFVAAEMVGTAEPARLVARHPSAVHARPRRSFASVMRPLLALAAAALLGIVALWWNGRSPEWTVFNQGVAVASVDGQPIDGSSLRPGSQPCEVCTPRTNLRLGFENLFRIELAKDSAVRLTSPIVGADGRVRAPITIDSGEIVCVTLGDSRLEAVLIETPTAIVRLSGASVSVLPHPDGSVCICVRSGSVTVASKLGERAELVARAGERAVVTSAGLVELATSDANEGRLRNLAQACDDLAGQRFESADYSRAWNVLEAF